MIIRGGRIVTADGVVERDIVCVDGRIAALVEPSAAPADDEEFDATGCLVFPGFIDPHVHTRDPGQTHKEDFDHATRGALVGGVTTIIEMPNALPPVDSVEVLESRLAAREGRAWVDYAQWGIALGTENLERLGALFEAGVVGVKLFWGYGQRKDTHQLVYNTSDEPADEVIPPPDTGGVLAIFREVAEHGGLLAAHCEDRGIIERSETDLGHPLSSYDDLLVARPAVAEAVAIATATEMARATGARFHVVHLASGQGLEVVREAQARGIRVSVETCPQYLTLTADDHAEVGDVMKVYPPIRLAADRDALWAGIRDGVIASIGSDHAPHTLEEKALGLADQPAGIVGCETFGPVLVDAMLQGRVDPQTLARVASTGTAQLYGMYPRKGAIEVGSDADFTIVDPTLTGVVRNEDLVAKQPVSPWNGRTLRGAPIAAGIIRGRVAMRHGTPVGEPGGRFVKADNAGPRSSAT